MAESSLLGSRYELGEALGHGGMAEVRRATDTRLGRTVAIKTLRSDLATDPTFQARFRREAQSSASLNHPAIVAVYDTGEEVMNGVPVPYIVMEYVEGRTLRDVLREGRRILPERALEITGDVCDALEYSHRAGIVHRDIKPANVMLTPTGDVKVMDFGIARAVADASSTMTQTAAVIGTAQYLSPEQARGETVDSRSDIYSTGCLLYELLTSQPPFVGDSPVSVAYQHVREEPRPPSMLNPDIPQEVDAITLKSLAKRPEDRYQSGAEMRADIDRYLAGQAITAPVAAVAAPAYADAPAAPPPPPETMTPAAAEEEPDDKSRRRRKWMWVLIILALLIILIGGAFALSRFMAGSPDGVEVPSVLDKTQQQAKTILDREGLKMEAVPRKVDDRPEGKVYQQNPDAGDNTTEGATVTVYVAAGEDTIQVPSVVGRNKDSARAAIEDKGLKVDQRADRSSGRSKGEVSKTNPPGGSAVSEDSTVVMYVSQGLVRVPSVIGDSESSAEDTLEDAGFDVDPTYRTDASADPGEVINQSPDGGSRTEDGSTVSITVAKAPRPDPEPTTTDEPTSDEPTTEEPTSEEPTTEEPTSEEPSSPEIPTFPDETEEPQDSPNPNKPDDPGGPDDDGEDVGEGTSGSDSRDSALGESSAEGSSDEVGQARPVSKAAAGPGAHDSVGWFAGAVDAVRSGVAGVI